MYVGYSSYSPTKFALRGLAGISTFLVVPHFNTIPVINRF